METSLVARRVKPSSTLRAKVSIERESQDDDEQGRY